MGSPFQYPASVGDGHEHMELGVAAHRISSGASLPVLNGPILIVDEPTGAPGGIQENAPLNTAA
jgi:hypothetical protein